MRRGNRYLLMFVLQAAADSGIRSTAGLGIVANTSAATKVVVKDGSMICLAYMLRCNARFKTLEFVYPFNLQT